MADDFDLIKISELPAATSPGEYDVLAGVQSGDTKQFSFATLLAWMQQAITASAIGAVPITRKINNKALSTDISLTAADVSAIPTSEKGVAGGVAELGNDGKVPSNQLPAIVSSAADVTYDNTSSGLQADDVQGALDELAAGAGGSTASTTTYDNTDSGLSATNVQDAIDEIVDEKADQATVATRETTTTATSAHPLGSIFYLSGTLYRALSDIAIGATINTGTGGNATQTTIARSFVRAEKMTSAEYAALSAAEKAADIVYIVTDQPVDYVTPDMIAWPESGSTASRAYSTGEYFCMGGTLYRVKTAIQSGATFTVGTNCEAVSGGGLNSLKDYITIRFHGDSNLNTSPGTTSLINTGIFCATETQLILFKVHTSASGTLKVNINSSPVIDMSVADNQDFSTFLVRSLTPGTELQVQYLSTSTANISSYYIVYMPFPGIGI